MIISCAPDRPRRRLDLRVSDADGRAYAIASATVPLNRYASCGTTPSRCRYSVRS